MPSDAELMDATLELAAERCEDITPLVYDRFFKERPDALSYFHLDDIDPMAHGRMLVEVLGLICDSARNEAYVAPTVSTIVADHASYGVKETGLYTAFLEALCSVFADLLGAEWTPAMAEAWQRQSARFLRTVAKDEESPRARAVPA